MAAFTQTGVELVAKGSREFFRTMGKASGAVTGFGKTAAKAALAGTAAVGAFGVAVGVASVKAAVSFESAFAGVIKTTDGLTDGFGNLTDEGKELQDGFRGLAKETPIAVEELLAIGELGGQLGIAREDLLGFTETIAAMGVATNLTTEEAAVGFAQLANIMGTPSDQISNMGSAVVALGNNFATTEADILNFATRIAGAGEIAGLTEAQVFGIGAAMSSVGVNAEAGGTAVQKVLLGINQSVLTSDENLATFAATAGLSATEFGAAWEADAGQVFDMFVQGLGAAGDDALLILQDLGLEDQRLIRSFLSLAGAGDLLTDAMGLSTDAFAANTALTTEAEQRYATTESQFQLFKNTINDLAITIGQALLPFLNQLLQAAGPLIEELGKKLPGFLNETLIPAFEEVGKWLGENLPKAIQAASTFWSETLQPILQQGAKMLGEVLPKAFEAVVWWIKNVTIPQWKLFFRILSEVVIPIIEDVVDWLMENIPEALDTAADFWENVLLPAMEDVSDFIEDNIIPVLEAMVDFFEQDVMPVIQDVADFIVSEFQKAVDWVQSNWPLIQTTVQTVLDFINSIIQTVLGEIEALWAAHGTNILNAVSLAWEAIKEVMAAGSEFIRGIVEAVMLAINGDWESAWELIKESLRTILTAIVELAKTTLNILVDTVFPAALDAIRAIVNNGFRAIRDIVEFLLGAIATIISSIWDDIKANSGEAWEAIKNLVGDGLEAIKSLILNVADAMVAAGRAIVEKIREGIEGAWGDLVNWFKDKLNDLTDLLPFSEPKDPTSPLRDLPRAGEAIINNIRKGMERKAETIISAMYSIGERMGQAFSDAIAANLEEGESLVEGLLDVAKGIGSFASGMLQRGAAGDRSPLLPILSVAEAFAAIEISGLNEEMENLLVSSEAARLASIDLWWAWSRQGEAVSDLNAKLDEFDRLARRAEMLQEFLAANIDRSPAELASVRHELAQILQLLEGRVDVEEELNDALALQDKIQQRFFRTQREAFEQAQRAEVLGRELEKKERTGLELEFLKAQLALQEEIITARMDAANILGNVELGRQADGLDLLIASNNIMEQTLVGLDNQLLTQAQITDEIERQREEQERILRLEQAQEQLGFLQEQLKLLELITERGLDPGEILDGLTLGIDASIGEVVDAMTRAMEMLVAQAEEELGIASPSRVAQAWGENLMGTLAMTIEKMAALPVRASLLAAQEVAAAPMLAAPMAGGGGPQTQISFDLGGNTFNTGTDEASFQSRTLRTVMRGMEGKV